MKHIVAILFFGMVYLYGVGPTKVATFDRSLWHDAIDDKVSYDKASRHEIISYVNQIINTDLSSKVSIQKFTGRDKINPASVEKWKKFTKNNLLKNFQEAQKSCKKKDFLCQKVSSWEELSHLVKNYKPTPKLLNWYKASQIFFSYYLYEQVRLAALFPRVTSEIDILDHSEMQGFAYADGEFLLTFDDGPKYGRTQELMMMLSDKNIHSLFFVLGENLEKALHTHGAKNMQQLYKGSCVGSHGFIHKSHQHLKTWQSSYDKTRKMITQNNLQGTNSQGVWFRPPYGQRHQMLIDHLATLNDKVMLWNIDSQDWNRGLSAKKVEDRVLTLMLLHRKGIILFHDIHPKAIKVVNALNKYREKESIEWVDCRKIIP